VARVFVPIVIFEFEVGADEFVAQTLPQDRGLVECPQGVQEIERQAPSVGDRVALGIHVDIKPLARIAFVFDAVETGDEPLSLDGLEAYYTAYPFEKKATFRSSDEELNKIWAIGWHTAQLDAHETYMDTPYYEQWSIGIQQAIGDKLAKMLLAGEVHDGDTIPVNVSPDGDSLILG